VSRRADRQLVRTGGPTRPWIRLGIRALAIALLVLGLAGGYLLKVQRQTERSNTAASLSAMGEAREMRDLKLERTRQWAAAAPQRAAQADAQAKADAAARAAADQARAADDAARKAQAASRSQARTTTNYPVPASCNVYTGNQAIGCALLLQWGYGLDQMPCLVNMWNKESHWNPLDKNPSSGAYGIPQALPATKMAPYGADYLTNPVPQIKWGLDYIKSRYKTPCGAWTFWQAHSWY
jgi:Transglycosylase SLT domain